MSDSFVPSETPDGFDFRGNQTDAYVPEGTEAKEAFDRAGAHRAELIADGILVEPAVSPSEALAPADTQVHPVASESAGYRAPRGLTRSEIRDRISKVRPYSKVDVDIPEWDIAVEVRSMSLGARNDMALVMVGQDGENDMKQFYPLVIAACTFDAEGVKVWDETDVAWLNSLDAAVLDKIAKPAMDLNGFGNTDKKVEDEAGKSDATVTSDSAL